MAARTIRQWPFRAIVGTAARQCRRETGPGVAPVAPDVGGRLGSAAAPGARRRARPGAGAGRRGQANHTGVAARSGDRNSRAAATCSSPVIWATARR